MIRHPWMIAALLLCALNARASAQERILNFDHDAAGGPPAGCESDGSPWRVADERQASSKPHVLLPPETVLTGGGLTHLVVSSAVFLTGDVGVRFRVTHEDPPAVLGLLWGVASDGSFEEVEVNTQTNSVSLGATRAGKTKTLASDSLVFTPNSWHLLQVKVLPKQLIVFLDNETILTARSSLHKTPGRIGLSVVPNSPVQMDDLAWRAN